MAKRKEIKSRDRAEDLVGCQNRMKSYIFKDKELATTCAPAHSVAVYTMNGELLVSTGGRIYFHLDAAMEFCQKIAAGEIEVEDVLAEFEAEDAAREQAVMREVTEKAKKFHARLDAMGLSYRELLELEVLRSGLGSMGHNILMGYERGEGWPVDMALDPGGAT